MQNEIKVSVLMLVYNHEATVAESIRSVFYQQIDFPCELIISNDHSTDNSRTVIESALKNNHNKHITVRVVHHPVNLGIGKNWEYCNKTATGKYMAVCEGDDYWTDPLKIREQAEFLDAHANVALVCADLDRTDENKELVSIKSIRDSHYFTIHDIQNKNFIATCTTMFRNGLLEFDEGMLKMELQDFISWNVILSRMNAGYYLNKKFSMQYVMSSGSYSTKDTSDKLKMFIRALDYLIQREGILDKRYLKKRLVYTCYKLGSLLLNTEQHREGRFYLKKAILNYNPFISPKTKWKSSIRLLKQMV